MGAEERGERVKRGVWCGVRDKKGKKEETEAGVVGDGTERVLLFFASKQTGDILKRGLLSPFVYSTCPFLEAFGSWETVPSHQGF